jgi:hypothetical protein
MAVNAPMPVHDKIATTRKKGLPPEQTDFNEGLVTDPWVKWFQDNSNTLASAATINETVELTAQGASIGTTSITSGTLATGIYRVTYYARITTVAVTSSSLTVTFSWVDGGVTVPISGTAITGNLTSSFGSGSLLMTVDNLTQITYSTTYASNGAGEMKYSLVIVLEAL